MTTPVVTVPVNSWTGEIAVEDGMQWVWFIDDDLLAKTGAVPAR